MSFLLAAKDGVLTFKLNQGEITYAPIPSASNMILGQDQTTHLDEKFLFNMKQVFETVSQHLVNGTSFTADWEHLTFTYERKTCLFELEGTALDERSNRMLGVKISACLSDNQIKELSLRFSNLYKEFIGTFY